MSDVLDVVVVDDEAAPRELLVARVRMAGHAPRSFASPLDALRSIAACVPDVVITDVNMPELNGLELAARIRDAGWGPAPYSIVTSASTEVDATAQVRGVGADVFVPKSIPLAEFEAELDRAAQAVHRLAPDRRP